MTVFVPRPYQHLIRNAIFNRPRLNVIADMGVGKTSGTLEALSELFLFNEVKRALVFAPRLVAETTWPDEIPKWQESFGHMSIAAAIGTRDERIAALRRNAMITTINYENIEWLCDIYGDQWPFDIVIADESTRLKGMRISTQYGRKKDGSQGEQYIAGQGSKRAKALAHVAHKYVRRWVNLSGSFASNGLVDAWAQQWFVDGGQRLGSSFTAYTNRWFRLAPGADRKQPKYEVMPYCDAQIHKLLSQTSIRIDAKDWFDIKEPVERIIYVDLPPKARQQYREVQRDLFTWINEHPLEVHAAGPKASKCLQIASGSVWIDREEKHWEPVHDEKIEALRSIVAETAGEPLLIRYCWRPDLERILKAFPQFKSIKEKGAQKDFEEGRLAGLVVHAASAGHGLNLQKHCSKLVDYSSEFKLEEDDQVLGRIGPTRQAQIGSDKVVFRYRLIARGTVEETAVLPALSRKLGAQEALKDAIKRGY